jgi:hypothetical protein
MNKRKFYTLAAKHGIEVEYEVMRGHMVWLQVWTPKNKVFGTNGGHVDASLCDCINDDITAADWPAAYAALEKIIEHGFHDCPDGDECDVCHSEHSEA